MGTEALVAPVDLKYSQSETVFAFYISFICYMLLYIMKIDSIL